MRPGRLLSIWLLLASVAAAQPFAPDSLPPAPEAPVAAEAMAPSAADDAGLTDDAQAPDADDTTPAPAPPPVRRPPSPPPLVQPSAEDDAPADAGPPPTPDAGMQAPAGAGRPAEVHVGDTIVFTLSTSRGAETPAERAQAANVALAAVLPSAKPDGVRVETAGDVSIIYVGAAPVVQLTEDDARAAGDASLQVHADRVASTIRQALKDEQQRTAVANTIFNVSLAVLFVVLAVFLLRRAWEFGDRAETWLEANPERVPALKLRSVEVLNQGTVRGALTLIVGAGRWIVLVGLVYAWLIATLSLFEATRGLTEKLSGAIVSPLASLASRVAASVPLIVILFFAGLTLALVLRAVRLFFAEVSQGSTTVDWLPKDLAAPTGVLAQLGLVTLALVLVAPIITGDPDGAFTRIGLVLLAAFGLASVPVVSATLVGAVMLYSRRLKIGDWVELGERMGRVTRVGLLEATLRDHSGVEVKVPHLSRLWNPTRLHGPAPRVTVSLVVERALATPALATRLERVLGNIGTSVTVRLVDVGATHVTLELMLSSAAADARSAMLWLALAEVETSRRESQ